MTITVKEIISRCIKRDENRVYKLIFIYVIITVAAMRFSCCYSSIVSLSTSRRHEPHPKKSPRDLSLVSFQSETSQPVSTARFEHNDCKRGMRRIQVSKSAALRCLVIGPSFFSPSKYTVNTKEEGAAAVDAQRRT